MIQETLEEFRAFFPKDLAKRINSIVIVDTPIDCTTIIEELYREIKSKEYYPSKCIGYLTINKHNNVPRIVPVLSAKDYFLYYFCVKILEKELVEGRVEGTYGGWSMGNLVRKMEDKENILLEGYGSLDSLNPYKWVKYWREFQKKAYKFSKISNKSCIVKLDIANFYNNINLMKLKEKIILKISDKKKPILDLLFFFLENWDKKFSGYSSRNIGLPMDKIGDCSRILANFYLQEYDRKMLKLCNQYGAKFLRYADDMLIYCNNPRISKKILFEASKILREIDLDINTGKVLYFTSKREFNDYWAFNFFETIGDGEDPEKLKLVIEKMIEYKRKNIRFKEISVIRRILNCKFESLDAETLERFLKLVFKDDFLETLDYRDIEKIFKKLNPLQKQKLIKKIYHLIRKTNFNSCLYNIHRFLKNNAAGFDFKYLDKKIKILEMR